MTPGGQMTKVPLVSSDPETLLSFTFFLFGGFSCLNTPPTFNDLFTFVLFGNVTFKIAAVSANVVVQGRDGKDADRNGIASEWTVFQRNLIAAVDGFGSTFRASTVFHDGLLGIFAFMSICCGFLFWPAMVLVGWVEVT